MVTCSLHLLTLRGLIVCLNRDLLPVIGLKVYWSIWTDVLFPSFRYKGAGRGELYIKLTSLKKTAKHPVISWVKTRKLTKQIISCKEFCMFYWKLQKTNAPKNYKFCINLLENKRVNYLKKSLVLYVFYAFYYKNRKN